MSIIEQYLDARPWGAIENWPRQKCDCSTLRRFYCPGCRKLVGLPSTLSHSEVTAEPLPLKVEVILRDDPTKATGIHAAILSPLSTTVHNFKDVVSFFF